MSMPLGLSVASHSGLAPAAVGAVAQAAELAGFSAVFVAEGHGDALALCHPVAAAHPAVPRLFGELDGGPSLRGAREKALAGDRAGAADLVPQPVADAFVAHGDAGACLARVAQYRAAGVDLPILAPMPVGGDWGYDKTIAAMAGKVQR